MSKTKHLAKKLGVISKGKVKEAVWNATKSQPFSYICVIDFEATCWSGKRVHHTQEIIEFPAVLLSILTGAVEGEFQHYIQPQENTTLSAFCTQLTGISQAQVDNGIPLAVCLRLFDEWVTKMEKDRDIHFLQPPLPGDKHFPKKEHAVKEQVAMATWSDWDLGVALHYECRRKQIRKAAYFNQWIDLRAAYKSFYDRKPAGLRGALSDLGLSFEGREHSGIDDARNTARLCWRMACDGCILQITKSLSKDKKGLSTDWNAPAVVSCLSCPSTVSSGETACDSADRVSSSSPLSVSKTGHPQCVGGRQPSGEEDLDVSLTSAEDVRFLSSIAGQVELGEPYRKDINTTPENSNLALTFKKPRSIPYKRPPSLSSSRVPLSPKAVNITPHSTFGAEQLLMLGSPLQSTRGSFTSSEGCDTLPKGSAVRMSVQVWLPSGGPLLSAMKCSTSPSPTIPSSMSNCMVSESPKSIAHCPRSVASPTILQSEHLPLPLKVTPPLCQCGRRAQERTKSTPGPNQGRSYFACSKRKACCGFFQWKTRVSDSVAHQTCPPAPAVKQMTTEYKK